MRKNIIILLVSIFIWSVPLCQVYGQDTIVESKESAKPALAALVKEWRDTGKITVTSAQRCIYQDLIDLIQYLQSDEQALKDFAEGYALSALELNKILEHLTHELTVTKHVFKKVLANGMTVVVRPVHTLPKVSLQIWYNVGAKDEQTGEKGIAHLIEHMIFKGTDTLSESDINIIAHKLSGSINAFTSYDFTGYLFNLPVQHWQEALPIMADCMQNVSFKDDHLNSEMKAVIQELKMNRDNYPRSLIMDIIGTVFPDHPYHYPVIGFKQDLFDVHASRLRAFYKKHYWPNNATLVIVGDVDVENAFALAEQYFGHIPANPSYKKEKFYFNKDIISHHVQLYRDIQQPFAVAAYIIPGLETKNSHLMELVSLIIGSGKGSRLYRKIVDELQLATSLTAFPLMLFEKGVFFIGYEPKRIEDIPLINKTINEEIALMVKDGLSDLEVTRALKQAKMTYYGLLENIESQATHIGKEYLATGDEDFAFHFLDAPKEEIEKEIKDLLRTHFRPSLMHSGVIMPLEESDKKEWQALQKESDEFDKKFLQSRERTSPIEPPSHASTIEVKEASKFDFPKYKTLTLKDGIKVLYYASDNTPKINLILELKARPYYDSNALPGIYNFVANLLTEGTKKYTGAQLADELESRGIVLRIVPGTIMMSMLAADFEKGLELLLEVISQPRFDENDIEKVREQTFAEIKSFWDDPKQFAKQLIDQHVYKGHPYSKDLLGTAESIKKITKKDLVEFHKTYFSPRDARLAIVGDIADCNLAQILEKTIGKWQGPDVKNIELPALEPIKSMQEYYAINRDQVVLSFAGLSVDRKDPDYDKLLIFDQIFGGGLLGSLHSRLFQLREQSGLFYTINGSLISGANEQPGIVMVKTIVSLDRLAEAENAIKNVIDTAVNSISEQEFTEAKHAIINSMVSNFATNAGIAMSFLSLDKYGFPLDFFDTRAQKLAKITIDEVKQAVKKVLNTNKMFTLKIGRVSNETNKD